MVVALVLLDFLLAGAAGGGDSRIRWHGAASPGGYGRPARRGDAVLGLPSFRVRQRSCPFSRRAALHPPEDDRRQAPGPADFSLYQFLDQLPLVSNSVLTTRYSAIQIGGVTGSLSQFRLHCWVWPVPVWTGTKQA